MLNHQRAMRAFQRTHPYLCLLISIFTFIIGIVLSGFIGFCPILLIAFIHWSNIWFFFFTIPIAIVLGKFTIDLIMF
jgi:hypothetical protein